MEENVHKVKQQFMTAHDVTEEGLIQMKEVPLTIVSFLATPFLTVSFLTLPSGCNFL
jgi:hypothetical protein